MRSAVLPEQAEGRIELHVDVDRRSAGGPLVLRSRQDHGIAPGSDDQQRFLEARIEAGEVGEIGEMLAVGIDDCGCQTRVA